MASIKLKRAHTIVVKDLVDHKLDRDRLKNYNDEYFYAAKALQNPEEGYSSVYKSVQDAIYFIENGINKKLSKRAV